MLESFYVSVQIFSTQLINPPSSWIPDGSRGNYYDAKLIQEEME